jgi:hypothetical protein
MSMNPGATTSPDAFAGDRHVTREPGRAGAVDDAPARDEHIEGGRGRLREEPGVRHREGGGQHHDGDGGGGAT